MLAELPFSSSIGDYLSGLVDACSLQPRIQAKGIRNPSQYLQGYCHLQTFGEECQATARESESTMTT